MKKIVLFLLAALIVLALSAPISANPGHNPPPPIWCPGPNGHLVLCSPIPTPQYCRAENGYMIPCATPTPAPHPKASKSKTLPTTPGMRYWFWIVYGY